MPSARSAPDLCRFGAPGVPGYAHPGLINQSPPHPAPDRVPTHEQDEHANLRDPLTLAGLLRRARPRGAALGLAHLPRALDPLHGRRHGALYPLHPGGRARPLAPGRQRAEVHPHQRHRQCGEDHPARHVLPDERQLLLRGLLQGGGDRLRLGPADRQPGRGRVRPGRGPAVDDDLGGGPGLLRPLDPGGRRAGRARPEAALRRDLLVHRPARPGRGLLRDPLRPRARLRPRRRPRRRRPGRPLPGDMEPRLRRVRAR